MFRKRSYGIVIIGMFLTPILMLMIFGSRLFADIEEAYVDEGTNVGNLIVVGVSQIGSESGWRSANTESLQKTFTQSNGFFLIFNNARQKQENQIKAIRSFISQRVDYIIFSPVVESGWDTVLQEAKEAGIPVIVMDRSVDVSDQSLYTTFVGSDSVEEGRKAGKWLETDLAKQRKSNEDINIVVLKGTEGSSAQIGRTVGFRSVAGKHENWHILEEKCAEFTSMKGREVMREFLRKYPDIDVVISQNDDMTFGAIEAIKESGQTVGVNGDIMIISFDAVKTALQMVAEGTINVDIECNPNQGEYLLQVIDKLEAGEPVEKQYYVEEDVFSIENVTEEVLKERSY